MRQIRLASLLIALAATNVVAAVPESASNAAREPVVLPSGAVVYPQGTDPDLLVAKSGFGPDQHVVNIPFSQFFPRGFGTYSGYCCIGDGFRWPASGDPFLIATIDAGLVPNGADLQQVAFYFADNAAGVEEYFQGSICRTWVHSDGSNPQADCPVTISSSGVPGDTVLVADPNIPVLYRGDIDGDGTVDVVSYLVRVRFGTQGVYDGSITLRQVRLLFARQVSPAPAVATFGDVPTNHGFFQFIEALADSGITAGCGSGNFCPDTPLTRGQMAVFLAKGLGLHWPAF